MSKVAYGGGERWRSVGCAVGELVADHLGAPVDVHTSISSTVLVGSAYRAGASTPELQFSLRGGIVHTNSFGPFPPELIDRVRAAILLLT